ncbi:MAG: glycoside hydrolase family 5 protein, partial [Oscillospiraceae bacterium]|nr:glycoside hydrolase family 5 protein [Oscillospiraceae bacterium]
MCIFIMPTGVSAASSDYSKMTANEFVKKITVGWNLGNTLDSHSCDWLADKLDLETGWGNPKTTKAMIKTVKDAGFNTVRIPVSWGEHMDSKGKIDKKWLDRVQEVVDYAYSQNMYVIINSHHDTSWIKLDTKNEKSVTEKFTYVWKQIA